MLKQQTLTATTNAQPTHINSKHKIKFLRKSAFVLTSNRVDDYKNYVFRGLICLQFDY